MRRPAAQLLDELRRLDEHERIEAKKGLGKEALSTVVAFSNEPDLGGGYILFGVEQNDDSYRVAGVPDPDKLSRQLATQCADRTMSRPLRPEIWTEEVEGERVVVAFVPELPAGEKPVSLTKLGLPRGAYRRVGSTDQQGTEQDLERYREAASPRAYEDTIVPDATMDDLDRDVIAKYRQALIDANPATELRDLALDQVVEGLGACRRDSAGDMRPTVAGVLLFAKPLALRRLFPSVRIDYLRVDGTKWVPDSERPFSEVQEIRAPLLEAFRRVYRAVLEDLPRSATFAEGDPVRHEDAAVPERVLREALVNAITHRSYRVHQPTQLIRYRNRIEIRNAGHSLVADDDLGTPGSQPRNPRIADVFREMRLAENKGTGIAVMRREMRAAHLSPPLFESDRGGDRFTATFFFHHLLGDEQRRWLAGFKEHDLSDAQAIALVYARENERVSNSMLRDLTGLDTLGASLQLRKLRDVGLLEKKGSGTASYYVLGARAQQPSTDAGVSRTAQTGRGAAVARPQPTSGQELLPGIDLAVRGQAVGAPDEQGSGGQRPPNGPGPGRETQGLGPETQGLGPETQGLSPETQGLGPETQGLGGAGSPTPSARAGAHPLAGLDAALVAKIERLGARPRAADLREVLLELCAARPWRPAELAALLGRRSVNHLVRQHLTPLVEARRLERAYPDNPAHPQQAYRTVRGAKP